MTRDALWCAVCGSVHADPADCPGDLRATGAERWKLSARGGGFPGAHPLNLFMASPILAGDKLIVAGGALEQVYAAFPGYQGCTGRGFVLALDPKTGAVWAAYANAPPVTPKIVRLELRPR